MGSVTSRLLEAVQQLESNQAGINWAKPQDSVSRSETRLLEIVDACKMIAWDILHRLEKLKTKGQPSVWSSVHQALKCISTKDERDALMMRLKAYISELDTAILVSLE